MITIHVKKFFQTKIPSLQTNNPSKQITHVQGAVTHLTIGKLEEIQGNVLEFLVDGADDGLNRALDRLHAGFQRTRILLGEIVDVQEKHDRVHGRTPNEL